MNARLSGRVRVIAALCALAAPAAARAESTPSAKQLLAGAAVRGRALVLVIGCPPPELLADLARDSGALFHVLDPDAAAVAECRRAARAAGLHGSRVLVARHDLSRLPHADGLCDAVIAPALTEAALGQLKAAEALRVLRPRGTALLGGPGLSADRLKAWSAGAAGQIVADGAGPWLRLVRPADPAVHDWSHWRSKVDNGQVASDSVGPPFLMQWFSSEPYFAYAPNIALAAGGWTVFVTGDMGYGARTGCEPRTIYAYGGHNGRLLWKHALPANEPAYWPGYVLTAAAFFQATEKGCLVLDPATGEPLGALAAPPGAPTAWKYIGLDESADRLFALLGAEEKPVQTKVGLQFYWGGGADPEADKWGDTVAAFDLKARPPKALWTRKIEFPVNGRSLAVSHGRLYYIARGKQVGCLAADSGKPLWTNDDPKTMALVDERTRGKGTFAPDACGVATESVYLTASRRKNVVAFSAADGRVLWSRLLDPDNEDWTPVRRILVYPDHVLLHARLAGYVRRGKKTEASVWQKIDPATGKQLGTLPCRGRGGDEPLHSGSCTLDTANAAFLYQSRSLAVYRYADGQRVDLSTVRSSCSTGTVLGNGLAYVTPSFCACGYAMHGVKSFAPAGDFKFDQPADGAAQRVRGDAAPPAPLPLVEADWPAWRCDNMRRASSRAAPPAAAPPVAWEYRPASGAPATTVTAGGGLIFLGGRDAVVRALDAATGKVRWRFCAGGAVRAPPALAADGRACFGSLDGHVYCVSAADGRLLWRYRVGPAERIVGFDDTVASAWPITGGVLVEGGLAVAAAGTLDFCGVHLAALNAADGKLRWQLNTDRQRPDGKGLSNKGILSAGGGQLYMPAGTSLAAFDLASGKRAGGLSGSRGFGAVLAGPLAFAGGRDLLGGEQVQWSVGCDLLPSAQAPRAAGTSVLPPANKAMALLIRRLQRLPQQQDGVVAVAPDAADKPLWTAKLPPAANCDAMALVGQGPGAIALAAISPRDPRFAATVKTQLLGLAAADGKEVWHADLPAAAVSDGIAIDRDGRILLTLADGRLLCLAAGGR